MRSANYDDRELVIKMLTASFDSNQSVNYIIKKDNRKLTRIKALMDYSFEICYLFGQVYLSDDSTSCALILFPEKKKTTLKSIFLDLKLILNCVGIFNIGKAIKRESAIQKHQSKDLMYYLWFIGVDPKAQGLGKGSLLLKEIIEDSKARKRSIFLETSTLKNIPWYQKFGFIIYNELQLSYKLYFLKREFTK